MILLVEFNMQLMVPYGVMEFHHQFFLDEENNFEEDVRNLSWYPGVKELKISVFQRKEVDQ